MTAALNKIVICVPICHGHQCPGFSFCTVRHFCYTLSGRYFLGTDDERLLTTGFTAVYSKSPTLSTSKVVFIEISYIKLL